MLVIPTAAGTRGGAGGCSKLSSSTRSRPPDSFEALSISAWIHEAAPPLPSGDGIGGERVAGLEAGQDEDRPLDPLGRNRLDHVAHLGVDPGIAPRGVGGAGPRGEGRGE